MFQKSIIHVFGPTLSLVLLFLTKCNQLLSIILNLLPINKTASRMSDADMANGKIWFDGVSKKLLEAHSEKKTLVNGNNQSLLTKTPLVSLSSNAKKRKLERSERLRKKSKGNNSKPKEMNGKKQTNLKTICPSTEITDELALDCEMVECYHHKSVLARVSIVNLFGHPILDRYVAPPSKVTDYRTKYSGIRRKDIEHAPDFDSVREEVCEIIKGKIVVGHAVHHDFSALKISHPPEKTRDTQIYYKNLFQGGTPSLKKLTESLLGVQIQRGEHDSVQDAQATMKLYVRERVKWEKSLAKNDKAHKTRKSNLKTKPKKKKLKTFYVDTS